MSKDSIYSVEQLNRYIKNMFVQDYLLRSLQVKGEISNCKYHPTGHIYFTLKEGKSSIKCVMFMGKRAKGLTFKLEDGQQVIIKGSIDVYTEAGQYQLYADTIQLDGLGALYEKMELLKRELEEEGMFAPEYKRPLPPNARRIGIATAKQGAAIRDIINVAKRRNPFIELILYPTPVQGADAAPGIVKAIRALDNYGVDVIIVGRGGGSIEDLWAFNERIVAEAIFNCATPVISAVGHEVDFTIADFVADKRAATPSAAAEIAVREIREIDEQINIKKDNLNSLILQRINNHKNIISNKSRQLYLLSPEMKLRNLREGLLSKADSLDNRFSMVFSSKKNRLVLLASKLDGLSPCKRLESGYAYVSSAEGKRLNSVHNAKIDEVIDIAFRDGNLKAVVKDIKKNS